MLYRNRFLNLTLTFFQACSTNHIAFKWSSQHRLASRGVHAGDFMLASSIILSGNHYSKIALLMKALGMKPMRKAFFYDVQAQYCLPAIHSFWENILQKTHQKYSDGVVPCIVGEYIKLVSCCY